MKMYALVLVPFTMLLLACGTDKAAPETPAVDTSLPGDPVAGEAIYKRACLPCHAADGRGNGGMTGGDFVGDKSRLAKGNDVLLAVIRDGKLDKAPPMPPQKGVLSEKEMKDALSYIRKTFGGAGQ